jgi:uncharacterized protein YndB with AHSA1/START domain
MPQDLTTEHSVTVAAPPVRVWQALTEPSLIKRWFFGVDTETDWKVGSPIVHKGEFQGKPYEDKGQIVRVVPRKQLVYTHWSEVSGLPDAPENYQTVTYSLTEKGGKTELTVSEVNLPSEQGKEMSDQSWPAVLNALRKIYE